MSRIVVLHSGGMDSTTLLYWALKRGGYQEALSLGVNYGQRHERELQSALCTALSLGVTRQVVDLRGLASVLPGSALTDRSVEVPRGQYEEETMRSTVVPNRNMILISVAAAIALAHEYDAVAYAAHAGDHAIYPDCRPEFFEAVEDALALCHYSPVILEAPFLEMSKADIAEIGYELGVPWDETWTCYEGGELHCGECSACVERSEALGASDPTLYATQDQ